MQKGSYAILFLFKDFQKTFCISITVNKGIKIDFSSIFKDDLYTKQIFIRFGTALMCEQILHSQSVVNL